MQSNMQDNMQSPTNSYAVQQTIDALEADGKLRDEHAAVVAMVRGLAASVDGEPGNASLWREFRAALETLRQIGLEGEDDEDEVQLIIAAIRGGPQVLDAKKSGSGKSRSGGGEIGGAAR